MHQEFTGFYPYRYEHLYKNNYNHLQAFYKKFYSQFQPKFQRPFHGMNPALSHNENQVTFESYFEGGNLDAAIRVAKGQYDVFIRIDANTRGHLQWYYFRVKNKSLQKIKINIVNFQRKRTLYQRGMKPFIKVGDGSWNQGGSNITFKQMILRYEFLKDDYSESEITFKQLSFQHKFNSLHEQIQFAYCIPYPYSRSVRLVQDLISLSRSDIVKQRILCESLSGLDLQLLTITDPEIPNKAKKCIFAIARQHPGESNGSFVMEGFLKWVCSDLPEAIRLRQLAVIKVVPMLNPDGVVLGNFRTSICGKDLNRLFKKKNTFMFPEVQELKEEIIRTKKQFKGNFLLFMDFHGHSVRKNVFTYGPGFGLGQNNYYKSRIFPKIISSQTKMFRYYSCSFRISQHKQSTARALISKYVPFCYTVETSNSSYYCPDSRINVDFTQADWLLVGKQIGVSSLFYLEMIIDEEKQAKFRLVKIKQKKQTKEHRHHKEEAEVEENMMGSTKRSTRSVLTSKSLGSKKLVKETFQLLAGNATIPEPPNSPLAAIRHYPPLPPMLSVRKYNQKSIIDEIKKIQEDLTQPEKNQNQDDESDNYEQGGSDSESSNQDLPDIVLKKFHRGASRMMLQFQNIFLKRNYSEINVPRSLNSTAKKRKIKEKSKNKQSVKEVQIPVMACLKSKVYPVEPQKLSRLQKFKSFQILEPLNKTSSIKDIIVTENRQKITSVLLTKQPLLKPPPKRHMQARNTISDRVQRIEQNEFNRFQILEKIDEQADSHFSGQVSICIRQFNKSGTINHDHDQFAQSNKLNWLNTHLSRRDRRNQYMELARQRLQEYLIRQNVGNTFDKQFLGSKIRVRNVSRTKDKQP